MSLSSPCGAWRAATRLATLLLSAGFVGVPAAAADQRVAGSVVDQSGRAVPRAHIRATTDAGAELATVFADDAGRFDFAVPDIVNCRLTAALPGFRPATATCGPAGRLVLTVAPVHDTIIVSATRTDAPASQVGVSATVFTAEDLERRQTPLLADLLATTPGAILMRHGGPGALTSLFVRGGESDYNKVLLDGVPLNEAGGTFYFNNLTTEHLDRVEIVRGAFSSLFGSDAVASVVQLFTRRADGESRRPRATVQIDGGTYSTWHAYTGLTGAQARFDYSLGVAHLNSDNRTPNSRLENTTLSGNVGWSLSDTATLRFIARGELARVGTPGPTAFGRPDLDATFDRDDSVAALSFDQQLTRSLRHRLSYSLATSIQTSTNLQLDPPYAATFQGRIAVRPSSDFRNDSRADLRRHHASYQADWRALSGTLGDHRLTFVADWDGEHATQDNRLASTSTRSSRNNQGVSAQYQALWRRVFATVGGRFEHNDSFGAAFVPRGTIVLVLRDSAGAVGTTHLRASAGTGIKEPTMLESFSISPFFLGNPDLEPERSRSLEVGVEQRLAGDRAKVEATWFDNHFRDIISLRTNPVTFEAQYFNVGVTRARGLELGVQLAPIPALRARGGYTLLDSEILESTAPTNVLFAVGQWAFRRPRHSGSLGVTFHQARLTADVNGVFIGRFVDSDFGLFAPPLFDNMNPGHTTWDARVNVALTSRLSAILIGDNLSNAYYTEPIGYEPLGRVVRAGLRVMF